MNNAILMLMPAKARPYAKAIVALLGSLVAALAMVYADNAALASVLQVLTVLGVYAQANGSTDDGNDDDVLDLDVPLLG